MKTRICSAILLLIAISVSSQIGINTPDPKANLDVNGTMKIRNTPVVPTLPGYQILALNLNTTGDFQVAQLNPQLLIDATVNTINTTNANTSVYAARKTTGINLLSLGIFPSGFRSVNFLQSERTVGAASLYSDTDFTYTTPSNGVYAIGFSFRYGTGLQAALLANSPGVGIVRTRAGVATLIDSRTFSGANLLVLSLTISETSVSSLYTLQAGDKISFGLTGSGLLDAGLLGSSTGSFYIYKVSN
ncbi:hypothetical protein SAMN05421664_0182 [Chryseobacterium soldanellicola]|uniref:C1q domain-containing protein n=1 Tax=Chryseobacterium soldanellicola TaxID=311333 RepID=A0A1H0XQU1_9FLAO|nr:hypothetical protein [Chryseobacterium soldanellicola]SDQ05270.1 hypothetical protein SAMN05421664_0182 [Chryseobacterium soldanellicola]